MKFTTLIWLKIIIFDFVKPWFERSSNSGSKHSNFSLVICPSEYGSVISAWNPLFPTNPKAWRQNLQFKKSFSSLRWRHQVPPTHRRIATRLRGVTRQTTANLTLSVMRTLWTSRCSTCYQKALKLITINVGEISTLRTNSYQKLNTHQQETGLIS